MTKAAENQLRKELIAALSANTDRLEVALREELSKPITLDPGRKFQFEIDPQSFRISSCESETDLLPDH